MPAPRNRRHIVVPGQPAGEPFRPHPRKIDPKTFTRPSDRPQHAAVLTLALETANTEAVEMRQQTPLAVEGAHTGRYIEFEGPPGVDLKIDSLDLQGSGIAVVAVHPRREVDQAATPQRATVFIPDGKLDEFLRRFEQYATELTPKGQPKHKELVDRIAAVRLATLRQLWTDDPAAYPHEQASVWWEVWLRRSGGGELGRFVDFCGQAGIQVGVRQLAFEDRIVCLALASAEQLAPALIVIGDLAELRRAKTSTAFFADLSAVEQAQWMADLLGRLTPPSPDAPAVCILDTGANRAHPLLAPALSVEDATAVEANWGAHDTGWGGHAGHGTEMAGLALYGDLVPVLESADSVELRHRLESVKILPPNDENAPDMYGAVTAMAVSRPEIQAPGRSRVFSLAVTAPSEGDLGQPTSWSAAVDALASGRAFDQGEGGLVYLDRAEPDAHRLFIVSAGNVPRERLTVEHLERSDLQPVQDPAQSWNALTVGACTDKAVISDPELRAWSPIALPGDLSPWSTTSCTFEEKWPNKPEVVFEGGNVAHDGAGSVEEGLADLCLLSTGHQPLATPFVLSHATSAATAQVARIAAIVAAEYPTLWPETRRALVVHSARWTPRMQAAIDANPGKVARGKLVRRYGFGVPDMSRAVRSANDALTLIVQGVIHPYAKGKMREMHVHQLPWPSAVLSELAEQSVRLRVTLSYFIEPNPGRRGWKTRHRYASHGLRFDVMNATESLADFRKRLNKKALDEDEQKPTAGSDSANWVLGDRTRHRGSLHCDIWEGTAAELAARSVIGIYPVSGWWKEQPKRDRSEAGARYALVVSIETDAENVDIWTPVAQQIGVPIVIET